MTEQQHELNEQATLQKQRFKFDRSLWSLKLLGMAHLALALSWFMSDNELITKTSYFYDYRLSLTSVGGDLFPILWCISALILIINSSAHWLSCIALILCIVGEVFTLSQLPLELINHSDRVLVLLSAFSLVAQLTSQHMDSIKRLSVSYIFTLWAWFSLSTAVSEPSPLWQKHLFMNFYGWTGAVPTPFIHTLGQLPSWFKTNLTALLLAAMAWGPFLLFLRVRLWPIIWLCLTPFTLWLGGGFPSVVGTIVWLGIAISLDQRWTKGLDARLAQSFSFSFLSAQGTIKWPLFLLGGFLSLGENIGIAPLLILALYFQWTPPQKVSLPRFSLSLLITLFLMLCFSLNIFNLGNKAPFSKVESVTNFLKHWSLSQEIGEWTQIPNVRYSLVFEYSDNGGGLWKKEEVKALQLVTLKQQPWRPLSPLRENNWYHQQVNQSECIEGPLMDMIEGRLREHIHQLNTPPLHTAHELILLRVRRVKWVRSRYSFWREEGLGTYCLPTNLPVLLKARALIKHARETKPEIPRLAPEPRVKKKSSAD